MKLVLIIEDDNFLQGLEAQKLKKEGYDVLVAGNAQEAFDHMEKNKNIDLVLLDLMLPEVDGFTVLKNIRNDIHLKNVPVIIFSNLSEDKDIEKAKSIGVSEFLVKSNFTLDQLTQKIQLLIGK